MNKYIFGLLIYISGFASAQQWHQQNPIPSAEDYHCIFFTSPDTGFIIGSGGIILKTTNSGNSWVNENGSTHNILYSVYFPTPATGYAAGDSGTILKTTNGGSDWFLLPTGIPNNLKGIFFTDVNTGYVAGSSGTIFRTTNGGLTWSPVYTGITLTIHAIYFTDANTGFAVSDNGKILKTTNGGLNWNTINTSGNSLYSVYFPSTNTGFAAGDGGHIAKTTDAGATWTYPSSGTNKTLRSIFFTNGNTGYIVGDQGTFLKTTDSGSTWIPQGGLGQEDLLTVCFTDPSIGFIAGEKGKILKSSTSAASWVTAAPSGWRNEYFGGVCFSSANTGFAVGDSGMILKTINGGTTWISLNSGTLLRLSGVHFPTANIGYAVGKNGKIIKTTNGGNTWVNQVSNCSQWLKAVYFSDNDHGCAVGGGGAIMMTSDGGVTWVSMICLSVENEDVFFTSNSTGYIAVSNGFIIKTTDYGSNWSIVYQGSTEPLYAVHFPSVNTGYAVGNNGEIIKTTNGGNTWIHLPDLYPGTGCQLLSVYFLSADTGIVVGTSGILAKTNDGGQSWITLNSGTDQSLSRVYFINATKGWMVGSNGVIIHGPYLDRPGLPTGPTAFCLNPPNSTYSTTAVSGATSYIWSLTPPGAGNISGNFTTAVVDWNNTYTGFARISVQAQSSNGIGPSFSDSLLVNIYIAPGPVGSISGPDTVCPGSSGIIYTVPVIPGATGYIWTVPAGATIMIGQNTNSITVTFSGSPGTGNVTVYAVNTCGTSNTSTLPVLIAGLVGTAGAITGPSLVCQGTSNVIYSVLPVTNATGYTWTVPPGASIVSGQNNTSILVNYSGSAISGNITIYATSICGNSNTSILPVIVAGLPGTAGSITGPSTVCEGTTNLTYSISPVMNAASYAWTVPGGWVLVNGQNTNSLTVNTGINANSGNITVYAGNFCGNSNTSVLNVIVNPTPAQPGPISGLDSVCAGSVALSYTVDTVSNVTGYSWTVPTGWTIMSGQNTNHIATNTGPSGSSGNIAVFTVNSCGNSTPSVLPVYIEPLPDQAGTITGPALICPGTTGVIYSLQPVLNAIGYIWSVPAGDSITAGQNTTSITVTFGITPGTGAITVHGINNCGTGQSSSLQVTMPSLPVANAGPDQTIFFGTSTSLNGSAGGGSGNYLWHWEPANLLINPNVQNPVTTPLTMTTLFTLTVTDQTSSCSGEDTTIVTITGEALSVEVYATPNPVCTGSFTQLQAVAMGGSNNYSYLWSSNPPGFSSNNPYPVAYPAVNTTYIVEVNDGYNIVTDSIGVVVTAFPSVAGEPSGPDTVDLNYVTTSEYTTTGAAEADYYLWELLPANSGNISGSGTTATVYWNSSWLGEVSIRVKGVNECGEGSWSDPKQTFLDNTGTTGLQESTIDSKIVLFPNPAHERFWIKTYGIKSGIKIVLVNVFGEVITRKEIKVDNSFMDIAVNPGIYFVIIQSQEQKIIRKLVIQ